MRGVPSSREVKSLIRAAHTAAEEALHEAGPDALSYHEASRMSTALDYLEIAYERWAAGPMADDDADGYDLTHADLELVDPLAGWSS